jgi:hypothetical protein
VLINVNCMLTNPKRIFFFTPCWSTATGCRPIGNRSSFSPRVDRRNLQAPSRCLSADAPATESAVSVAGIVLRQNDCVDLRKTLISCQWGGLTGHQPWKRFQPGRDLQLSILPRKICEAIERRPNQLNNLQFIKEFDDHLRRESQILVWMGQFHDLAWTRSELAENMT